MKKIFIKHISLICILALLISSLSVIAYAEDDGSFVSLSITGIDNKKQKITDDDIIFYNKGDKLYATIAVLENYTLYKYDESNSAFVREGQNFSNSNSKIIIDYEKQNVKVVFPTASVETYGVEVVKKAGMYFLQLDKMAALLKASVKYIDDSTISIINSGVSICDALYDLNLYDIGLGYFDICDDLFAGDESTLKKYIIFEYFGNTVFSFKVTNLIKYVGDTDRFMGLLENAITNTDPYEKVFDNFSITNLVSDISDSVYSELYKKSIKHII